MIPKFLSWAVCWMPVPFSTYSRAPFQFISQLSILNGICHLNYPNSLGSSPAVPHYEPKSCRVLGTPLLSHPPGDAESHQIQLNCLPPTSLLPLFFLHVLLPTLSSKPFLWTDRIKPLKMTLWGEGGHKWVLPPHMNWPWQPHGSGRSAVFHKRFGNLLPTQGHWQHTWWGDSQVWAKLKQRLNPCFGTSQLHAQALAAQR